MSSSEHRSLAPVTFLVFDVFGGGGVSRATVNLANRLAATRQVRVISLYRRVHVARFPLDATVELQVLLDVREPRRSRTGLDRLPSRLRPAPSERNMSLLTDVLLRRAIRGVRSGVVVSTRPSLHLALTAFARPEVATIGWDHLNFPARMANLHQAAVLRAAVPRLDGYVVLTEADAADYHADMPGIPTTIAVIRNAVSWPLALGRPLEDKVVVAAGRLVRRKGFRRLVQAFAPVAAAHPNWHLHIYGRGEQKEELESLVRQLGLQRQVRLQGYTDDLPGVLRRASVYAMASHSEGFPMVLIEAMSMGLPLIAFDCPRGPAEIIRHGQNGLLIENGRQRSFTRGLLQLVRDAELRHRMGRQALQDAEGYTIDQAVTQWQRVFALVEDEGTSRVVRRA